MSGIVDERANDTIATMLTAQSSNRRGALEAWVDDVLDVRGVHVVGPWQAVVGDASFRTFHRVHTDAGSLIAMDAPPATENNAQFVRLSKLFRAHGVGVPEVLASDLAQGFLLVSDLGEQMYSAVYQTDDHDAAIEAALDTLVKIAPIGSGNGIVPAYTTQRFHDEFELFRVWLVDGLLAYSLTDSEGGMIDDVRRKLIESIDSQPRVCVHRDFHSRNLLWGPDRTTRVVDFQDALHGPALYDLASLLRDCYVRFDEAEISRWRDQFRVRATDARLAVDPDPDRFARMLDLTAMQRQLKALGIFARLDLRDARPSHLVDIEPVIDHLVDVGHMYPDLNTFADWLAQVIRPAARDALATRGVAPCAE